MGTPLRQILNPKILSPIVVGAQRRNLSNSPSHKKIDCAQDLTRKFNALFIPQKKSSLLEEVGEKLNQKSKILITVTDESFVLLNTPNKHKLMRNGFVKKHNTNILGKGSFGIVVRGMYKGKEVAVKVVKSPKNTVSLLNDKNAMHLQHKNVTKILDILEDETADHALIVMEHLNFSQHLQKILDDPNRKLNRRTIVNYALDVCGGLQYCHQNGVLHLDLKPSNVLVCEDGSCKLCDFGNSLLIDDLETADNVREFFLGTVAYIAPEILLGKSPCFKSDVYSLGILLWQMLYRQIPYSQFDCVETIIYRVVKFGERPSGSSTTLEDEYANIYSKCWMANSSDRPDLDVIINALNSLPYNI